MFVTVFNIGSLDNSYAANPSVTVGGKRLDNSLLTSDIYDGTKIKDIKVDLGQYLWVEDSGTGKKINDPSVKAKVVTALKNYIKVRDIVANTENTLNISDIEVNSQSQITIKNLPATAFPKDKKLVLEIKDGAGFYTKEDKSSAYTPNYSQEFLTTENVVTLESGSRIDGVVASKTLKSSGLVVKISRATGNKVSLKDLSTAHTGAEENKNELLKNLLGKVFTFTGESVTNPYVITEYFDISVSNPITITVKSKLFQDYPEITNIDVKLNELKIGETPIATTVDPIKVTKGLTATIKADEYASGSYKEIKKTISIGEGSASFTNVSNTKDIVITFSEGVEIKDASLTKLSDFITLDNGNFSEFFKDSAFTSGDTITLTPTAKIESGKTYNINVDTSKLRTNNTPKTALPPGGIKIAITTKAKPVMKSATIEDKIITVIFSEELKSASVNNIKVLRESSPGNFDDPVGAKALDPSDEKIVKITLSPAHNKETYKVVISKDKVESASGDYVEEIESSILKYEKPKPPVIDKVIKAIEYYDEDGNKLTKTNEIPTNLKKIVLLYADGKTFTVNSGAITATDLTFTTPSDYSDPDTGFTTGQELDVTSTLELGKEYKIIVDKSKFDYNSNPAGTGTQEFTFTTLTKPEITASTEVVERGTGRDGIIKLTFSKKVELDDAKINSIKIDGGAGHTIPVQKAKANDKAYIKKVNDAEYQIVIPKDLIDDVGTQLGKYDVTIPNDAFHLKGYKSILVDEVKTTLTISKPIADLLDSFSVTKLNSSDLATTGPIEGKSVENVYVNTGIEIKFKEKLELIDTTTPFDDVFTLSSNGKSYKVSDYFDIGSIDLASGFDNVTIPCKADKGLDPDKSYVFKVNTGKLKYSSGPDLGESEMEFTLTTEKSPKVVSAELRGKSIVIKFDRNIDINFDASKPFLKQKGIYTPVGGGWNDYEPVTLAIADVNLEPDEKTMVINNLDYNEYIVLINFREDPTDYRTIKRKEINAGETPVYAAQSEPYKLKIKPLELMAEKVILKRFDAENIVDTTLSKSEGITSGKNTDISPSTTIDIYYNQPFTIKNKMSPELEDVNNAITIAKITSPSEKTNIKSFKNITDGNGGISLTLETPLASGTEYALSINKQYFYFSPTEAAGNDSETYNFITVKAPEFKPGKMSEIEKKAVDQEIMFEFDSPVELLDADKIKIKGTTIDKKNITVQDNIIKIIVKGDIAKDLEIGEQNVTFEKGALIRKGVDKAIDSPFITETFNAPFSVIQDKEITKKEEEEKKKQEEEKKKKEEEEKKKKEAEEKKKKEEEERKAAKEAAEKAYRESIAEKLAEEMSKRLKAEYGTLEGVDVKTLKDRIEKNGYLKDYLDKYGYDIDFVEDYINRYGASIHGRDRSNSFQKDPFRESSHKKGYYDYYNYYDYGYRFPSERQGEDMKSQETLEYENSLKAKERELFAIERELNQRNNINTNAYSLPLNNSKNRMIQISIGSRYAQEYDHNNVKVEFDLGTPAFIQSGRTMVPVSQMAEVMGISVNYDNIAKDVVLSKPGITAVFNTNTSYVYINGVPENMGIRPTVRNGRTLIPLHYMAKSFGLSEDDVIFNQATKTITIRNY